MKRKASRASSSESPRKLNKSSSTIRTVSEGRGKGGKGLSKKFSSPASVGLHRVASESRGKGAGVKTPSYTTRTPSVTFKPVGGCWSSGKGGESNSARLDPLKPVSHTRNLPVPKWPTLVPTSKRFADSISSASSKTVAGASSSSVGGRATMEVSEDSAVAPGLRRLSTLPLAGDGSSSSGSPRSLSKTGSVSRTLSKTKSKSSMRKEESVGPVAVATLEKKGSVVTLDTSGTVTTVTRLASGSSIGLTAALSTAPASIRKELTKAAEEKEEGMEVNGDDEAVPSLSKASSKAGSVRKEGSLRKSSSVVPGPSTTDDGIPLPPGGLIEIAFSFDTTGSMSSCIDEVRGRVGDMIQRLQADIPGIRIAVIAHGDYCDEHNYVIKWIDFGSSLPELSNFVQTISGTGGGDFDECYELVMARAQTELSWTPGSQRSLVVIGDATPHPPSYYNNRDEKLDWKVEAQKLADMGVKIYSVQAMDRSESKTFYRTIANVTKGRHLQLNQFNNIFDIIMAVCYNERGVEFVQAYEDEVREREGAAGLHKDLEGLFSAFRGGKAPTSTKVTLKGAAKAKKAPVKRLAKAKKTAVAKPKPKKAATTKGKKAAPATPAKKKSPAKGKVTKTKVTKASKVKAAAKAAAKKARGKGVKSVKGRKPAKKAAKKKTAKVKKTKKLVPGVKRKFREAVKDEELTSGTCLKKITWSKWIKAIMPSTPKPKGLNARIFKPRSGSTLRRGQASRSGLRNLQLLKDSPAQNAPALFEIAVQPPRSRKLYVVYLKASFSLANWRKVVWDTILLNASDVHVDVNAVVDQGGIVWLRRGEAKSRDTLKQAMQHINKNYDYAWRKQGRSPRKGSSSTASGHRRIKRSNILISGN